MHHTFFTHPPLKTACLRMDKKDRHSLCPHGIIIHWGNINNKTGHYNNIIPICKHRTLYLMLKQVNIN